MANNINIVGNPNLQANPIAEGGAAEGGGVSASHEAAMQNLAMSFNRHINELMNPTTSQAPANSFSSLMLPQKRQPLGTGVGYDVPEGLGQIPLSESAVNGAFKNQPTTNPQKAVFLTYNKGKERYSNCKLPLKINIPAGEYGLYKIAVNEVLFRNDSYLFTDQEWLTINLAHLGYELCYEVYQPVDDGQGNITYNAYGWALEDDDMNRVKRIWQNIPIRLTVPDKYKDCSFNYLSMTILGTLLQAMIDNCSIDFNLGINDFDATGYNLKVSPYNGDADFILTDQADPDWNLRRNVQLKEWFKVQNNYASGNGISFICDLSDNFMIFLADNYREYNDPNGALFYVKPAIRIRKDSKNKFSMTCSDNLRNILVPFASVREIESGTVNIVNDRRAQQLIPGIGIDIPYLNFAGPLLFLLNTSAQTTCPISNDNFAQFNCCALSYNTSIEPQQLIQMTSNIPLILKEGTDFRVWLTDMYGNEVTLNSPIYIQVSIEQFNNDSSIGGSGSNAG